MLTEDHIRDALRVCYDPEIPLNIVDLGCVHSIRLAADPNAPGAGIPGVPARQSLLLNLISATADEDRQAQLLAVVENRLAGMPKLSRITVALVDDPVWNPAAITPEGRRLLKLDQPQFPILNNRVR